MCPCRLPNAYTSHAPSPKPDPFAPRRPEKTVTFLRRPCSGPATQTSNRRPTTGPRLRSFSPPLRPNPAVSPPPLAICVHTCYPRPGEGQTPRPGIPTPSRDYAPGIRRGVPCGRPVPTDTRPVGPSTPCPTLSRGVTLLRRIAHAGIAELRRTVGAPS